MPLLLLLILSAAQLSIAISALEGPLFVVVISWTSFGFCLGTTTSNILSRMVVR